ncbi:MAG: acetyl-CoA carboxylase biotin carboxylase subunit [Flammeovirgaceae bacterium]|nr:acetyl-CoA carboxylase biotin carboxylase subunit [Flammeovirgaceae bacterium]|tara:strand:+ start:1252 stop:2595 length:1344 start_codon:yes stop_codon:yes gene_type:complete
MINKILIANRGEIALRIIRSCKEMGINTVAVYSTIDRESLHVKFADEAVCIGPPNSKDSYLNIPKIIAAAEITNSEAIHPGYGFLAENSEFSKICSESKIKFIGPTHQMIERMGDKITAKKTMEKAGIPTVPGSKDLIESVPEGKKLGKKIGYPIILKATAGGGGKGMRIVNAEKDFKKSWEEATNESSAVFGNSGLYIEKYIEEPRHIEIQIVGDKYGNVSHLSERDCSIQRRHQKLIEETPSPFVDEELREKMGQTAIKAGKAIDYEGAGTIEFIVDKNKNFYFMEMNTRIQVEHGVTEEVTDFDLIKEQIKVTDGAKVSGKNYYPKLHAIECRINAEDPKRNFIPSPGKITNLHIPGGHGVRVDSHVYAGYTIPPNYDSMIAKIITTHQSRDEAIVRMKRALEEFVIEGIHTTIPLHLKLMNNKSFCDGNFTTKFLDNYDFKSI